MATTYITGEQTKQRIKAESRKLFYKKGFSKTTYDDISKATQLNRALIPYHFTNKQILGEEIYKDMLSDFINTFDTILDIREFSADFVSILHLVAYYHLLKDAHFTSYVYELQAAQSFSASVYHTEQDIIAGLTKASTKLSDIEQTILITSEIGMKKELISLTKKAMDHQDTLNIEEIAKIQLSMLLGHMGYTKKKIDELYNSANEVINLMEFHVTENFAINITFR